MKKGFMHSLITLFFVLAVGLLFGVCGGAQAATVFFDDFEDGNHDGWYVTEKSGSTGVEFINDSNWAYVHNSKYGLHSLSLEFEYQPDFKVAFDIQAAVSTGRGNYGEIHHTAAGVNVFFENSFNMALGEVSFAYATNSSMLPSNGYSISTTPQFFDASMLEWAELALVDPSANITNIGLEFWAIGSTAQKPVGRAGTAHVRFDNVEVSTNPVPIPGAAVLLGSGLIGLAGFSKRRKGSRG